ncbi:hypothetical protein BB559_005083 [Furculomyces boomerangus]|uniref:Uncharacterized protein n=1 Tax=Furculomyces boomerangus TaxID=61424 RepID=A0A2T9YB00_9FUNG|nr:hypothetical protein BB559_005083 [Furculomyces boomerangus]
MVNNEINILELQDDLQTELLEALDSVRGKKILVLDDEASSIINLIANFSLLQEHGVEKVFNLKNDNNYSLVPNVETILYIIHPTIKKAQLIASHIKENSHEGRTRSYSLKLIPSRTLLFEKVLEEEGVLGDLNLDELPFTFVPLENDLLTMNCQGSFKEMYLDGDFSSIYHSARGIMQFQSKFGFFPRIVGKGDCAQRLADSLLKMRSEISAVDGSDMLWAGWALSTQFDALVIIDRGVDVITPQLTQLTYEGILDEFYHIKNESIELSLPEPSTNEQGSSENPLAKRKSLVTFNDKKRRIILNAKDKVFHETRNKSFSEVGKMLSVKSKTLQSMYESRHNVKSVKEVKDFVKGLGGLQNEQKILQTHVAIVSNLIKFTQSEEFNKILEIEQALITLGEISDDQLKYIDQLITLGNLHFGEEVDPKSGAYRLENNILVILRLLCLYSLTKSSGVKKKVYESLYTSFINSFGYQHLITLNRLDNIGLFGYSTPESGIFGKNIFFGKSVPAQKSKSLAPSTSSSVDPPINTSMGSTSVDIDGSYVPAFNPSTKPVSPTHSDVFGYLRRTLNLSVPEKLPIQKNDYGDNPDDISYAYSGYVPISIRLLQYLTRDEFIQNSNGVAPSSSVGGVSGGWRGFEDVLDNIAGKNVDTTQTGTLNIQETPILQEPRVGLLKPQATLVFFLGGITYSEIACIRYLSKKHNHQYIVATTEIINGTSFLRQILEFY